MVEQGQAVSVLDSSASAGTFDHPAREHWPESTSQGARAASLRFETWGGEFYHTRETLWCCILAAPRN